MIATFNYAGTRCDERQDPSLDVLAPPTDESVTWVDVGGVHKIEILESFGKQFQLHPFSSKTLPTPISGRNSTTMRTACSS